jgi:hypothetical protein
MVQVLVLILNSLKEQKAVSIPHLLLYISAKAMAVEGSSTLMSVKYAMYFFSSPSLA